MARCCIGSENGLNSGLEVAMRLDRVSTKTFLAALDILVSLMAYRVNRG